MVGTRGAGIPRATWLDIAAWLAVAIAVAGAAIPALRVIGLGILAAGAAILILRRGRGDALAGAWLGAVAVGTALAWGATLAPSMALPDATRCADPASPTAVARGTEAIAVLVLIALLAPLARQPGALRLVLPSRRIAALAAVAPAVVVPITLWIGPAIAAPFFGRLDLATGDLRALLPAAVYAIGNAVLEELAYRGALMGWAARILGPAGALVGQAVIFGFAHMGSDVVPASAPVLWAGMALSGLIAGIAVVRTRSLLLAFSVHAAVDVSLYYAMACRLTG